MNFARTKTNETKAKDLVSSCLVSWTRALVSHLASLLSFYLSFRVCIAPRTLLHLQIIPQTKILTVDY